MDASESVSETTTFLITAHRWTFSLALHNKLVQSGAYYQGGLNLLGIIWKILAATLPTNEVFP